ncbi:unnamed protein product [Effrenium voratum]|nr:unnamed protein product [Effrenium voratum]
MGKVWAPPRSPPRWATRPWARRRSLRRFQKSPRVYHPSDQKMCLRVFHPSDHQRMRPRAFHPSDQKMCLRVFHPTIIRGCASAFSIQAGMASIRGAGEAHQESSKTCQESQLWEGTTSKSNSLFSRATYRAATATRTFVGMLTPKKPRSVFQDTETLKQQVHMAIHEGEQQYDVELLYWETGLMQRLARSNVFQNVTLAMILIYALWLSYDTDTNTATTLVKAELQYQVVENLFCAYFLMELVIRFLAFKVKRSACSDGWFVFDALLVTMGVAEVWIMSLVLVASGNQDASLGNSSSLRLIRLLRLSRLARKTARLLRAAPELLIMVKGMTIAAARSMLTTGLLVVAVLYVFGIAMRQAAEGTEGGELYFSTVWRSMFSLLVYATLLDSPGSVMNTLNEFGLAIFLLVIALSALLLLNMLIGVMCEVVSGVSQTEREAIAEAFVRDKVQQVMVERHGKSSIRISRVELLEILNDRRATRLLAEAGVDVMGLVDVADFLFQSDLAGQEFEKVLSFEEFLRVVMSLRSSNSVTLKDIMDLRRTLHNNQTEIRNNITNLEERMNAGFSICDVQSMRSLSSNSAAATRPSAGASPAPVDSTKSLADLNQKLSRPLLPSSVPSDEVGLRAKLEAVLEHQEAAEARHAAARRELQELIQMLPKAFH